MEQSILKSTKKLLNVDPDDPSFDLDIITHINTAFSHLYQIGIGPADGFEIEDDTAEWNDFLADADLPVVKPVRSAVKTNIVLQVRLAFDPPQIWHILNAMTSQLQDSEARLSLMRETTEWTDPDPGATRQTNSLNTLGMEGY